MKDKINKLIEKERNGDFGVGVLESEINNLFDSKLTEIKTDIEDRIKSLEFKKPLYHSPIRRHQTTLEIEYLQSLYKAYLD